MNIINQPAAVAAGLTAIMALALACVASLEAAGVTTTCVRILLASLIALACLVGVIACVFWPVVGVL